MLTRQRRPSFGGFRGSGGTSQLSVLLGIVVTSLALAALMANLPYLVGSAVALAIAVFIACFVSTEFGLYLLVFPMLLSPEFGGGSLGGDSISTASWGVTVCLEDLLLLLLGFGWLIRIAVHKDLGLVRDNSFNGPIGYYIAACLTTTIIGATMGHVNGKTGFFFVLKYIECFVVYFIVLNNIHSRKQIYRELTVP